MMAPLVQLLPWMQSSAELSMARVINTLPEGVLIALFVGILLRFLPRQNAGTKFAVWMLSLVAVAGLPGLGSILGSFAQHSFLTPSFFMPGKSVLTFSSSWVLFIFSIWALIASVALLRLGHGLWNLHQLRKSCVPVDLASVDSSLRYTFEAFNGRRPVSLATSENIRVPAALGLWSPMIVLPPWMLEELPPGELNVILLHEYAHIERLDDWTNLLQKVLRALLFFHPAIWWIDRRLSLEREMACDDAVVARTANPRGYAECLVTLLEKSCARRQWSMMQALVGHTRDAYARIKQLLEHKGPSTTRVWKPALGLVTAFSIASLVLVLRAPQLVSFAPKASSFANQPAHVPPEPIFPAAKVIPAGLHRSASALSQQLIPRAGKQHLARQLPTDSRAVPQAIPAKMKARTNTNSVVRAAYAPVEVLPSPRLLIFFESTEQIFNSNGRIDKNSSITWSLQVWRIMVIDPEQVRAAQLPAAKTT